MPSARNGTPKKKSHEKSVDWETGSIAIEGFEFEQKYWSCLVPNVVERATSLILTLIPGDEWQIVLDLKNQLLLGTDWLTFLSATIVETKRGSSTFTYLSWSFTILFLYNCKGNR